MLTMGANDPDVLANAMEVLPSPQQLGLHKLWIAFGQGQNLNYSPIHDPISYRLEERKVMELLSSMHPLDVMYSTRVGMKSAYDKRGIRVWKSPVGSPSSANTYKKLRC